MSEQNNPSTDEFSDQLRRMVNPSVVEGSEELFYQLGWEAANAVQTTTTQRNFSAFRPFAIGLATGIAAVLALTLNTEKQVLEIDIQAQKTASDKTSRDINVNSDPQLARQAKMRHVDELESVFAFVPACATHGLSLQTRSKSLLTNSDDGMDMPKNQSVQSFRQQVMKEMNL